jgi:hypothetical protein
MRRIDGDNWNCVVICRKLRNIGSEYFRRL